MLKTIDMSYFRVGNNDTEFNSKVNLKSSNSAGKQLLAVCGIEPLTFDSTNPFNDHQLNFDAFACFICLAFNTYFTGTYRTRILQNQQRMINTDF